MTSRLDNFISIRLEWDVTTIDGSHINKYIYVPLQKK